jgi:hypothetical protein
MFIIFACSQKNERANILNMSIGIIQLTLEKLTHLTGLMWKWETRDDPADGVLSITDDQSGKEWLINTTALDRVGGLQWNALKKDLRKAKKQILLATKISPAIREKLRASGLSYLDSGGNAFVKQQGLYLLIECKDKYPDLPKEKRKLFTKTGILIVFHLLASPSAIEMTYREWVEALDISLGSVTNTLSLLKERGYLLKKGEGHWRLHNREELLHQWVHAYREGLREQLVLGRYRFADKAMQKNWLELRLPAGTCWSGEPAALMLNAYLRPAKWTLYTTGDVSELMKALRILPDNDGEVWVLRKFWNEEIIAPKEELAPALLVYADLADDNDARTVETAQMLYDEFLTNQL